LSANMLSGSISPGNCIQIGVMMNAANLEPGLHLGELIITSNDPDDPTIEVPVEFEVTAVQDVIVTPDTLWFLTYEDMINGKLFNIHNPSSNPITINDITDWGSNFAWTIDEPVSLPYQLPGGEDLELKVVIIPPPQLFKTNILYDDLFVTTEYGTHTVVVAWDSDLIALNTLLEPDTLWFTDPASWFIPQTATFTNTSFLPLTVYEIQMEPNGEFVWYVQNISVQLPHLLLQGESLTFDAGIDIPVDKGLQALLYDSIAITSDAGMDYLKIVLDADLVSVHNPGLNLQTRVYPSPFANEMTVEISVGSDRETVVEVIDAQGRIATKLHNGLLAAGNHKIRWNGTDISGNKVQNGIWFVRITSPDKTEVIKILKMN
jgi:hypothetical protein